MVLETLGCCSSPNDTLDLDPPPKLTSVAVGSRLGSLNKELLLSLLSSIINMLIVPPILWSSNSLAESLLYMLLLAPPLLRLKPDLTSMEGWEEEPESWLKEGERGERERERRISCNKIVYVCAVSSRYVWQWWQLLHGRYRGNTVLQGGRDALPSRGHGLFPLELPPQLHLKLFKTTALLRTETMYMCLWRNEEAPEQILS